MNVKNTATKQCHFCTHVQQGIQWEQTQTLSRFISSRGKILPGRSTGTCAKHQRKLARAIKRARTMALLPFVVHEI